MVQIIRQFTSTSGPLTPFISELNSRIKEFVSKGLYVQAIKIYKEQVYPVFLSSSSTRFILPSAIKACANTESHGFLGPQIHCSILKIGFDTESTVSNSLLSMYAKFADTRSAYKMFETMPHRDTVSWNSMLNCFSQNGYYSEALKMFKNMYIAGLVPKPELIASVLSICVLTEMLSLGRAIHGLVTVDERLEDTVFVSTALVDFYWKSGDFETASRVFHLMEVKNEVSWTAMVSGCVALGHYSKALDYFRAMQGEDLKPNIVTLISVLPACAELGSIKHGKEIHGYAFRHGMDRDFRLLSSLIHTYSECGVASRSIELIFERSMEKDIVMWSSIIKNYAQKKDGAEEAIHCFNEMQREGMRPNDVTMLAVISACTNLSSIRQGQGIHGCVLKSGYTSEVFIQNSLINMYCKCGCLAESDQIFKEMSLRDSVSWSALINAYGLYGHAEVALRLFQEMQESGMKPDAITFLAVLLACDHAGLVDEGEKLFKEVMNEGNLTLTIEHYACYVDLLGRAGKLEDACDAVYRMPLKPSARVWSSVVSACKLHGRLEVAERLAHKLIKEEPENAANYTLLSMVYAEGENWLKVQEVRRVAKDKRVRKKYGFSKI